MTQTTHNNIPVTIFKKHERNYFDLIVLYKSGIKNSFELAKRMGVDANRIDRALAFLRQHKEIV